MCSSDLDTVRPTVSLSSSVTALNASTSTALISITLSEASTDFAVGDLNPVGGGLSGFGGSGTNYTVLFTPTANATTKATGIVQKGFHP